MTETRWPKGDVDLFRALLEGGGDPPGGRIDQMTDPRPFVERWPIARIDPTLRAIFRAAGAELVAAEAPPRVVISEFVDIAKAFFPEGKERSSSTPCSITWRAGAQPHAI